MEIVCHSVLFADKVITEDNGKKGLIGIFSNFSLPQFPVTIPPWFIYICFSNLEGKHELTLNLVREEVQEVLIPISGEIDIKNKDDIVELVFPIVNLTFKKAGNYTLTFNIDGKQIASRILPVKQSEQSQNN